MWPLKIKVKCFHRHITVPQEVNEHFIHTYIYTICVCVYDFSFMPLRNFHLEKVGVSYNLKIVGSSVLALGCSPYKSGNQMLWKQLF